MLPVVVGRNVARDHHHGNAVQRSVGDPGGGVGQARAKCVSRTDALRVARA